MHPYGTNYVLNPNSIDRTGYVKLHVNDCEGLEDAKEVISLGFCANDRHAMVTANFLLRDEYAISGCAKCCPDVYEH